jgi:hypothetical protein
MSVIVPGILGGVVFGCAAWFVVALPLWALGVID